MQFLIPRNPILPPTKYPNIFQANIIFDSLICKLKTHNLKS